MEPVILHIDLNNFYASVECLYNPEWRSKPLAVAGNPELRHGIVLAKNYAAKAFGVATGDPLWMARQKCPDIVFVPPHYDLYLRYSRIAREIYGEYTDQVEPFGLDECWLDVTGSGGIFGSGKVIADELRRRIRFELGVTASVGVSYNKIFAKLGSDYKKPDATTVIDRENWKELVWPLSVEELLCVGNATKEKLNRRGVTRIGQLAQLDPKLLYTWLKKPGVMLWTFANGLDRSPVGGIYEERAIKSVGNSTTAPRDLVSDRDVKITLYALCESVSARMRERGLTCDTVQTGFRDDSLVYFERQGKIPCLSRTAQTIFSKAYELYRANAKGKSLRSISVRACNVISSDYMQLSFLDDPAGEQKRERLETAMDSIRGRFGHFSIQRGIMLTDRALSDLDPKNDHTIHPESFFR